MLEESAVTRGKLMSMVAVLAVAIAGFGAQAAELNTLRDLKVVQTGAGAQVVVTGTRAPTFTVFRLSGPERLVVDLSSADATGIKGHHSGQGPVSGVVASQFSDERASVGRVLVALQQSAQYDVRADGNRVIISVDGAASAAPAAEAKASEPKAEPVAPAAPEVKPAPAVVARAEPAAPVAPAPQPAVAEPREKKSAPLPENVVAAEADERDVAHPARRITGLTFARDTLSIRADGEVARYEVLELADPPRLAVDVYGVGLSAKAPRVSSGPLKDLRVGAHSDKVRLVMDVRDEMPAYRVERTGRGLSVVLGGKVARKPATPSESPEKAVAKVVAENEPLRARPVDAQPAPMDVKDLTFDENDTGGRVNLKLSGAVAWKVERPDPRSAVLTLENAKLPRRLERSLDTSALETPVKMISAFSVPGEGNRVRVVVAADGAIEENVSQVAGGLSWRLSVKDGVKTEQVTLTQRTAGFTAEAPTYASEGAPQQARYRGKKVSFEFKDIDIQNLLRVIAEISKKNIVVADDVTGKVTIRLRNVPWDQALDLVLRTKSLGKEEIGNIVRVAPLKTLEEEAKLRQERKKSLVAQEELLVNLVPVNYAVASDMAARVKDVLSERGNVTVDTRTNVLIVKDVRANIEKARALVRNLDTQTPQVLIESRIVEANTSFSRELGVQWGGRASASPATGNATGLIFPNSVVVGGGIEGGAAGVSDTAPNFAVSLPAGVGLGSGGALGFSFGSAGGALAINLRLSAAETEGVVKTISAPKVTTLDNNTARISQGVSIPFSQVSASGANTTFVEARLSLEVTPHITQDGSILMTINAQNNQPDPANTGANGQPAIQRKEANTQVLVKDGDTTVIGGIYVRRGSTSTAAVPYLSKIPVLGLLFKNHRERDDRQELLIFITPRILNRQTIAQSL
ncbi:type IV pilus secretin PilQ [Archangium sp.]|uniref:type IV pilus secretin PilQ n=1 Tax=Archangium sp. TaxID=1872627 RepID=UPI00389A15AB